MYRRLAPIALVTLLSIPAFGKNLYIPVAGVANGPNNTLFRTDVRIFNPSSTEEISVTLHFLPAGMDGRWIPGRVVKVGPRRMAVLNDVVSYLQWPAPVVGAIRLDSDVVEINYEFAAESRTYTDSPNAAAPGTLGQFIPALDPSAALRKIVVPHLSHSSNFSTGFRTNAGAMNPNLDEATITPRLFSADGTLVAEGAPFVVPPRSVIHLSLPAMVGLAAVDLQDGYLLLDSNQPIFGYGSVVDNRSGDQMFVLGQEDLAD